MFVSLRRGAEKATEKSGYLTKEISQKNIMAIVLQDIRGWLANFAIMFFRSLFLRKSTVVNEFAMSKISINFFFLIKFFANID